MSDVFGFDEAIQDLERYSSRANNINEKVYQEGIKMRDDARNIDIERVSNGVEIGWSNRPNFHLFFHEFGFHATGRKKGKRHTSRSSKGKRKRRYKTGTVYVPPKPHLRPAFDRGKDKFQNNIKKYIEGD